MLILDLFLLVKLVKFGSRVTLLFLGFSSSDVDVSSLIYSLLLNSVPPPEERVGAVSFFFFLALDTPESSSALDSFSPPALCSFPPLALYSFIAFVYSSLAFAAFSSHF